MQHYVILEFASDLREVVGFFWVHHQKTDSQDITEILLKVALNTNMLSIKNSSMLMISVSENLFGRIRVFYFTK